MKLRLALYRNCK